MKIVIIVHIIYVYIHDYIYICMYNYYYNIYIYEYIIYRYVEILHSWNNNVRMNNALKQLSHDTDTDKKIDTDTDTDMLLTMLNIWCPQCYWHDNACHPHHWGAYACQQSRPGAPAWQPQQQQIHTVFNWSRLLTLTTVADRSNCQSPSFFLIIAEEIESG